MGSGVSCMAWLDPAQAGVVASLATKAGLNLIGAGSPVRGQAGAVAAALRVTPSDDLRNVLTSAECEAVLILATGDFGADPGGADTGALAAARTRGVRVISLEPIPGSASELSAGRWLRPRGGVIPIECVRLVPTWVNSPSFRHAAEVVAAFGAARSAQFTWIAPAALGSLGSRLLGAMGAVQSLMGEPETIDAAYAWPNRTPGLHALPGESLRELTGDLTANLRFGDGRAASILVSDQGGAWRRGIVMLGDRGAFEIDDSGFAWRGGDGELVDSWLNTETDMQGHTVLAEAIRAALDETQDRSLGDLEGTLAMAQAALLSVRTGQAESPGMIRRIFAGAA